jgi:hypothetical protein
VAAVVLVVLVVLRPEEKLLRQAAGLVAVDPAGLVAVPEALAASAAVLRQNR